jgi:hypothetical protein
MRKRSTLAFWIVVAFGGAASLTLGAPHGIKPRASADNYHSHFQRGRLAVGAELLTPKQVQKTFTADVNRCCLVVEVAFYAKKDEPLNLYLDAFSLSGVGSDASIKPQSASVIAAAVRGRSKSETSITGSSTTGVGYESGTRIDPVTGQPTTVHGIYTISGAEVGVGNEGPAGPSTEREREIAEKELKEKSLPEGKASSPVAGYLYFPISNPKKDAKYQLECAVNTEKLALTLP